MTPRLILAALICLAASGCAFGDNFFGPPLVWVEDQASSQPGMRADGYPGEPAGIASFPGWGM